MNELSLYDSCRRSLAECATMDEAKDIADKAEALRVYARQTDNIDLEKAVARIKLRAKRRVGELSKKLDSVQGQRTDMGLCSNVGTKLNPAGKRQALADAKISVADAHRCEKLADIPAETFESIIEESTKPITVSQVITQVTRERDENARKHALQTETVSIPSQLFVGDFRDYSEQIPDNSIELIFTDPPYDRASIPLFADLAEAAERVLKPGGSLLAYCGQIQLPHVLASMSQYLRYWWVNACVHSGPKLLMQKYGIRNDWKPIVWFVKGTRGDVSFVLHDTVSGVREKNTHEWQQAQLEAEYYIEKLCSANGTVWDPFAGGGTTIVACKSLNRHWIACETDKHTAHNLAKRIAA